MMTFVTYCMSKYFQLTTGFCEILHKKIEMSHYYDVCEDVLFFDIVLPPLTHT